MKLHAVRSALLGTALLLQAGAFAQTASDNDAGRRIDNARVDIHGVGKPAETAAAATQAPSGTQGMASACAAAPALEPGAPFRITIDGEPMNSGGAKSEADLQRCTDLALEKADIQVHFDALALKPAMNVWAYPNAVLRGTPVEFRAWSNYIAWAKRAELRVFKPGQQTVENPLQVIPWSWGKVAGWTVPADAGDKLFFLLRVYDDKGRFDETALKELTLIARPRPAGDEEKKEREINAGYGENSVALRNIPITGGTVTVNGRNLAAGQSVMALGEALPIGKEGKFAIKQILPPGPQVVEVTVTDADGKAMSFRRNLTIASDDWFFVAVGDLTFGRNQVTGPAALVTGDTQHYEGTTYVDGRGAFYLKGKIKGDWLLTAAADTTEQPLRNLFSNFSSKDPTYLLRNIDPNLYYPVYGDDSTALDDAPTQGKFYVKLERGDSYVMWGNFQTSWSGTQLLQFSRGLYGANLRLRSDGTTSYGEKRTVIDGFAADPGTIGSRDEFRGTGGSLYYLRNQDITQGSERLWVEERDRDSGLALNRTQLTLAQDYQIDYLQGRIILQNPLSSSGSSTGLVVTSSANGNLLYLVVTYEFVPGLTAVRDLAVGGHASHWFNDYLQLGLTAYHQGESGNDQTLKGADATFRYKPGTWFKVETAQSKGPGDGAQASQDGGFAFNALTTSGQTANAHRIDASVDLAEVTSSGKGKITAYAQQTGAGFSAPGQIATGGEKVTQQGIKGDLQFTDTTRVIVKADVRNSDLQDSKAAEFAVRQQLDAQLLASVGLRRDERENTVANASPTLSQNGGRTDLIGRLDYQPLKADGRPGEKEDWKIYGFVQGTLERDGTREANNRGGVGGEWRYNDRIKLLGEVSDGSLGFGGRLGADYRLSDRSNAYLTYVIETETPDVAWTGRQGSWVSGVSTRVSDSLRLFGETRETAGAGPSSLSQAFGIDWAANDRWTFGTKMEFGTISDPIAGDLERHAAALSASYKFEKTKYAGTVEWRDENSNVTGDRITWLMRNTFGYQASREWRFLGKANVSHSTNSMGAFYDGNFYELVAAAAYRPVTNDRWNTLFKYTNLYNLPSPGQVTTLGTVADYAQKSQVLAVDTIYDLRPWLAVGVKYAIRVGDLKTGRDVGDWYSSRADLLVLRADFHWVKEWDAVIETRDLREHDVQDARAGFLIGLYRHLGEGVKAGAGYNFTRYSDDLTDQAYRSRGWFINVLGEF